MVFVNFAVRKNHNIWFSRFAKSKVRRGLCLRHGTPGEGVARGRPRQSPATSPNPPPTQEVGVCPGAEAEAGRHRRGSPTPKRGCPTPGHARQEASLPRRDRRLRIRKMHPSVGSNLLRPGAAGSLAFGNLLRYPTAASILRMCRHAAGSSAGARRTYAQKLWPRKSRGGSATKKIFYSVVEDLLSSAFAREQGARSPRRAGPGGAGGC